MTNKEVIKKVSSPKIKDNEGIQVTSLFKENGKTIQQIMDEVLKNYQMNKLPK